MQLISGKLHISDIPLSKKYLQSLNNQLKQSEKQLQQAKSLKSISEKNIYGRGTGNEGNLSVNIGSSSTGVIGNSFQNQVVGSTNSTFHTLSTPTLSLLFTYIPTKQSQSHQLNLHIELNLKNQTVPYSQLFSCRYSHLLYKHIELDSCSLYGQTITALILVKYAENEHNQEIKDVEELNQLLAARKYVVYPEKSLYTYKRDIMVCEPVGLKWTYHPDKGYILLKCIKTAQNPIVRPSTPNTPSSTSLSTVPGPTLIKKSPFYIAISALHLMNWLVKGNQAVKIFDSWSAFETVLQGEGRTLELGLESASLDMEDKKEKYVILGNEEELSVMLTINQNIYRQQIPLLLQYRIGYLTQPTQLLATQSSKDQPQEEKLIKQKQQSSQTQFSSKFRMIRNLVIDSTNIGKQMSKETENQALGVSL